MRVTARAIRQREVDEREAREQRERGRQEALTELRDTDWRVIRAAEALLAEQGKIDQELRDRRQQLRSTADDDPGLNIQRGS